MNDFITQIKPHIIEAGDISHAFRNFLKEVSFFTSWNYGEVWLPDHNKNQLQFLTSYDRGHVLEKYKKFTSVCKFAKGVGLIGRVWKNNKPVWINDISSDNDFLRLEVAQNAGFHSAFAFSLKLDKDNISVIAFFMKKKQTEDEKKSEIIAASAEEIGKIISKYFQ